MIRTQMSFLSAVLLALAVSVAHSRDAEIKVSEVPTTIIDAVKAAFPGCKIVGAEMRSIDKKLVYYGLDLKTKGQGALMAYFTPEKELIRTGTDVKEEEIPAAVRTNFKKQYGDWTLKEINKETIVKTKQVVYSAAVTKGGKTIEVEFDPNGNEVQKQDLRDDD